MKHVAILDFGSQYTHLISRNIREFEVLSKIYPHDVSARELKINQAVGIIISGGPQSVYDKSAISVDPEIFNLGVPILGLCYGHQLIAHMLGGKVKPGKIREYGSADLEVLSSTRILAGIGKKNPVWMSHGDSVKVAPAGFSVIGKTKDCPVTAMADEKKNIFGFQFHPEVAHTKNGSKILDNFISICKIKKNWKVENLIDSLILSIKKQAGRRKVLVLVSGGVDSSVAFALLTKALGSKKVLGLYIDTGFMRQNESEEILDGFKKAGFKNIKNIDASDMFLKNLEGVTDPEEKRKIIGQTFLDVRDKLGKDLNLNEKEWMLGQGTIYPDTIESGATKNADQIKTHHNRVDAIQKLIEKGMVIEPLVEFYKDEVRMLGNLLKLPKKLINRHPFPGPGLAIRCLCSKSGDKNSFPKNISRKLDSFFRKNFPSVSYALLPVRSVGVQGDNRTYAHPLAVWGINPHTKDAKYIESAKRGDCFGVGASWKKLAQISRTVTNSIKGINRVIFLLNPKKENIFLAQKKDFELSKERIDLLRNIDSIVNKKIEKLRIYQNIWQFPTVMIPITDKSEKESIVLRPINSRDAMTLNFYEMEKKAIKEITKAIEEDGRISHIFYDITDKPPGTVEWE